MEIILIALLGCLLIFVYVNRQLTAEKDFYRVELGKRLNPTNSVHADILVSRMWHKNQEKKNGKVQNRNRANPSS